MTKEEIDKQLHETLGIQPSADLFADDAAQLKKILSDTEAVVSEMNLNTVKEKQEAKAAVEAADRSVEEFKVAPSKTTKEFAANSIIQAQTTLESITEQTQLMSDTVNHIYGIITSSGIVDPDLVSSFAVLVSSAKDLWAMKLDMYKMLMNQIHQINMENIKQQNRLELEEKKFELKKRLLEEAKPVNANNGDNKYVFDNSSLLKKISAMKRGAIDVESVDLTEPNDDQKEEALTEKPDFLK